MRTAHSIIHDHYAASTKGDLDGMLTDLAPHVQWTEMAGFPCAGTYVGAQAVVEGVFKVLGRDWSNYSFALERLVADVPASQSASGEVIGIGTYHGTHRATQKTMQARVAHVWQVKSGQIVAFEQFTDTHLVQNAMR